jgi:hypothetical protein
MVELIFQGVVPALIGMSIGWALCRGKRQFPLLWTSRLWFFVQVWVFTVFCIIAFGSLGVLIGLSKENQAPLAEFLLPIVAAALFTRLRLWPTTN